MYFTCAVFLSILSCTIGSESDYDGPVTVTIFHSLSYGSEPEWELRGNLVVQNVELRQSDLQTQQMNNILSVADDDGYYRLKAIVTTSKGREIEFYSFVKACALVESQLTDILTLSLDHEGSIIAVTLSSPIISCGRVAYDTVPREFNTTVDIRTIEQGPIPDTASYIQKIEREREARERGETKDNRSFFAKYWMYIIPVVVFVVLSGATNPEGAAAGGGGR